MVLLISVLEGVNAACKKTVDQPTIQTIRDQVLLAQGPVVTFRSFKHSKKSNKHIAEAEYMNPTRLLEEDGFGRLIEFSIPRARGNCKVFIQAKHPWPSTTAVSDTEFDNPFHKGIHSDISAPMRAYLQNNNFLS